MKKRRVWLILAAVIIVLAAGAGLTMKLTAVYPGLGEAAAYPVNDVGGFELTVEKLSFTPLAGYTVRWRVTADSDETYRFIESGETHRTFEYLERSVGGVWYRLGREQDALSAETLEYPLGGDGWDTMEGSIVQKDAGYGTRLEPGLYRVVLEMEAEDGTTHYLAREFEV